MAQGWFDGNETALNEAKLKIESKKAEYIDCLWSADDTKACQEAIQEESRKNLEAINKRLNTSYTSSDDLIRDRFEQLEKKRQLLADGELRLAEGARKVERVNELLWTLINALFVLGGMIGSFASKLVLDALGRKKGILFNLLFTMSAAALVFVAPIIRSPVCLMLSRFLYGLQGGMSCSLVPIYLAEIAPASLRGSVGTVPQLFITLGILVAQVLGFKQILGKWLNLVVLASAKSRKIKHQK